MKSPEVIYQASEQSGEVVATLVPPAQRLLLEGLDFGFALKRTLDVLAIDSEPQFPFQLSLKGEVVTTMSCFPDFVDERARIARASSFEQSNYSSKEARHIRSTLYEILTTGVAFRLVQAFKEDSFTEVCRAVIDPFVEVVTPGTRPQETEDQKLEVLPGGAESQDPPLRGHLRIVKL